MTYFTIQPRYYAYIDTLGDPLDNGYIYFGQAGLDPVTYPAKAAWDDAGLYPVTFPVRTLNGYPLRDGFPAQMYLHFEDNEEYSVLINDADGVEVFSSSTEGLSGYFPSDTGGDADTLGGELPSYYAVDADVAHLAGAETFTGNKTVASAVAFNIGPLASDAAVRFYHTAGDNFTMTPYSSGSPISNRQIVFTIASGEWNIKGAPTVDGNTILTSADIEESTFTPVIEGETTAGVGTYTLQFGSYQKIGSWIHFRIQVSWTAHTGTGNMLVSGLPYTANATRTAPATILPNAITYSGDGLAGLVINSSNYMRIYTYASGTSYSQIAVDTSGFLHIGGSYETA